MLVINDCRWDIPGGPTEQPRTKSKISIVTEREESLVETTRLFKNSTMIKGGTSVGPKDLFRFVVLADIAFHCSSAAILSIPVNQMTGFVDHAWRALKKDFARQHANAAGGITIPNQFG